MARMTTERAKEILRLSHTNSNGGNSRKFMTSIEILEVMSLWDTMDGDTCFNDALVRISQGMGNVIEIQRLHDVESGCHNL